MKSFLFLTLVVLVASCQSSVYPELESETILIKASKGATQLNLAFSTDQLAKFSYENKFIGIVPNRLGDGSTSQKFDFYTIENPTIDFDEFNIENIKSNKLEIETPRKIASITSLAQVLNASNIVFDNFTVATAAEAEDDEGPSIEVKFPNGQGVITTVSCTCPCTIETGTGVTVSC